MLSFGQKGYTNYKRTLPENTLFNYTSNKIDEEKIVKLMSIYIDKLIFNITSLCALLSLKMGAKKILDSHIKYLLFYINKYLLFVFLYYAEKLAPVGKMLKSITINSAVLAGCKKICPANMFLSITSGVLLLSSITTLKAYKPCLC